MNKKKQVVLALASAYNNFVFLQINTKRKDEKQLLVELVLFNVSSLF